MRRLLFYVALLGSLLLCSCRAMGPAAAGHVIGEYAVDIKSYRLAQNQDGTDVLLVRFAFTNNWEEAISFYGALYTEAHQGDAALVECYDTQGIAGYDESARMKNVRPGTTTEAEVAYVLTDTTAPVTVTVSKLFTFDSRKITRTFSLQ